jgi:hypothetical protein
LITSRPIPNLQPGPRDLIATSVAGESTWCQQHFSSLGFVSAVENVSSSHPSRPTRIPSQTKFRPTRRHTSRRSDKFPADLQVFRTFFKSGPINISTVNHYRKFEFVKRSINYYYSLRRDELVKMKLSDVEDKGSILIVKVPDSKTILRECLPFPMRIISDLLENTKVCVHQTRQVNGFS